MLEGGPGLGKNAGSRGAAHARRQGYAAHYLSVPHEACSAGWFMPHVARAFGVPVLAAQVSQLIDQIHAQLVAIVTARRMPVLLIDEAQLFRNREAMEEFRGLLNLSHEGKRLISLVLFGLPELGELLKLDPPLAQRVEVRVEMTAMDWLESQAYVAHRLRLAGATQAVFGPDALEALFRWSGGVPPVEHARRQLALRSVSDRDQTDRQPRRGHRCAGAGAFARVLGLGAEHSAAGAPAPDLLGSTAVQLPPRPSGSRACGGFCRTIAIAKPSPCAARAEDRAAE